VLSGLVTGSFWALGAVFASRTSASVADVTYFVTTAIVGGALLQYPIGWLSDRVDRALVLVVLCILGALASVGVAMTTGHPWHLAAVFVFGALTMPLYAMALAIAADNSASNEFVLIGTSVLLLNALSATVAPLALGQLMDLLGAPALFHAFGAMLVIGAGYVALQRRVRVTAPVDEQVPFSAAAPDMAPTHFDLDPRGPEDAVGDLTPTDELPSLDDQPVASSDSQNTRDSN
jgi:MFS family permease